MKFGSYTLKSGWSVLKLVGGLRQVRTIVWDPNGHMLVSQAGKGISVHTFGDNGCVNSTNMLISSASLNHGLAITPDGKTLYASGERTVYQYDYDPVTMKVGTAKTVVQGIDSGIHSTRTLMVVAGSPNMVLVQCGSNANFDMQSADKATARAGIKIFDMSKVPSGGYAYKTGGETFGYGLRNEIGFTADPNGIVWGVENSGDVGAPYLLRS
jgi:glucose/arabinose dehydrogenase